MAKFKVGDEVITRHGEGKIVECDYSNDYFLVYHKNWSRGHNGGICCKGTYEGNHCWWFEGKNLPLKESSYISLSEIKRYIINENATIIFWEDGEKTVVKRCSDEPFKKELGFLYAYFQKTSGLSKTKANKFIKELKIEQKNKKYSAETSIKSNDDIIEKFKVFIERPKEIPRKFEIGDIVNVKYEKNETPFNQIKTLFEANDDIDLYNDKRTNKTQIRYTIVDWKFDGIEWNYIIENKRTHKKYAFKETALRTKVEFNA